MTLNSLLSTFLTLAVLAATPASASDPRLQKETLAIIHFELMLQGFAWAHAKHDDALAEKFQEKKPFPLPAAFLESAWPYASTLKPNEEPPNGKLSFPDQIPDLQNKTPVAFMKQISRYFGSLGVGDGPYPYVAASHMPASECEALGDSLHRQYGGRQDLWRKAAVAASKGIDHLVKRAILVLVNHVKAENKILQAKPDKANADIALVLSSLEVNLAKHTDLYEKLELMHQVIDPIAKALAKDAKRT